MPRSPVQETRLWSLCLRLDEYLLHRLSVIAASLSVIALVLSYHAIVILCVCTLYVKAKVWCWVSSSIALYLVFFFKDSLLIHFCMYECFSCMYVSALHIWSAHRGQDTGHCPWNWSYSYELPYAWSQEQRVLLTAEPFVQPLCLLSEKVSHWIWSSVSISN